MSLLLSQKNSLYDLIDASNYFSPAQFDLSETIGLPTKITFKDSSYDFIIFHGNNPAVQYSPDDTSIRSKVLPLSWANALLFFERWLQFLKREVTAPNKWERLIQETNLVRLIPSSDEGKFTYQEYAELTIKMDQIKQSIGSIPLLATQQSAIITRLDHLTELAKDLNKFDWKNLFVGTIISIIIQLNVTPQNAAALWETIRTAFSGYFLLN